MKSFRKRLASLLTAAACAVGLIGGSGGAFFNARISAVAVDESAEEISDIIPDGTYVVSLSQRNIIRNTYIENTPFHFYGQAILKIDGDVKTITIPVESWSLYDAFVPMSQDRISVYTKAVAGDTLAGKKITSVFARSPYFIYPEKLFDLAEDNGLEFKGVDQYKNSNLAYSVSSTEDEFFSFATKDIKDKKLGDIDIEYYDENLDVAYVSFDIKDYNEKIAIAGWLNTSMGTSTTGAIAYRAPIVLSLDVNDGSMYDLDELKYRIDNNEDVALRVRNGGSMDMKSYPNMTPYTTNDYYEEVFQSVTVNKDNNIIKAKYKLGDNNISKIKVAVKKNNANTGLVNDFILYLNAQWEENSINNNIFTLDYKNDYELAFGKYVLFNDSDGKDRLCTLCLSCDSVEPITIADKETGIFVKTKTSILPKDVNLKVELNKDKYAVERYDNPSYKDVKCYSVSFEKNGKEYVPNISVQINIPVPEDCNSSDFFYEATKDGDSIGVDHGAIDYDNNVWITPHTKGLFTFSYMYSNPKSDVTDLDDGIYSAYAYLTKSNNPNQLSMSNNALIHDVILIHEGNKNTIFLNFSYLVVNDVRAYIGKLYAGEEKNTKYTKYLLNDNSTLGSNSGYDPITEWACVLGAIIECDNNSWNETDTEYDMHVDAPAMAALAGEEYDNATGTLTAKLGFRNVTKLSEISDENYNKHVVYEGLGYHKSALLRKIRLAEVYLADEDMYTSESISNLESAKELAQTVYDNEYTSTVTASNAYEEQINLVQSAIDALVLDESAIGDKTELESLVAKAKAITADEYTDSSYAALTEAIEAAEKVLAKDAVKQSRLDEQVKALQSAIDALEKKPETALDKDNLADGKYTLTAEMIKTDRKSKSMSNNAINHTVQLEIVDGEYFVTVQFKGLAIYNQFGYLKDLGYYDAGYTYNEYGIPQGTVIPAEVLSTYDTVDQYNDADNLYPQLLKFKLVDKASADFVPLQVFVPIMEAIAEGTGTQDVLMQLDWSTLVKVDDDAPIDIEEPEEQSPAVDLTDAATGVKIHADKGVFEEGVQLVVTPVTSGSDFDNAKKALDGTAKAFSLYEIHFIDKNGSTVQPNGTVSVSIPVPSDYSDKLAVYRINDNAGKTLMSGEAKDGYYTYLTKSFSYYALADVGGKNEGGSVPQTGAAAMGFAGIALAGTAMIFTKRRKTNY